MKMLSLFIIISTLLSCKKEQNHILAPNIPQKELLNNKISTNQQEPIKILSHLESFNIEKLQNVLIKDFFKTEVDTEVNKYFESSKFCIYSINVLNDNLPNALKNKYAVIDLKEMKTQYIIDLEVNKIFEIDNEVMLGGFYSYREYDYYQIYKIENTTISSKLDTRKIQDKPIVVGYYKNDECIDYLPDRFNFKFDITKKEILFEGIIDNYCKSGADRFEDSSLQKRIETSIFFNYNNSEWIYEEKKSNYFFW